MYVFVVVHVSAGARLRAMDPLERTGSFGTGVTGSRELPDVSVRA